MKKLCMALMIVLAMVMLVSCSGNPIIGSWIDDDYGDILEFKRNGTGTWDWGDGDIENFKWNTKDGILTLTSDDGEYTEIYELSVRDITLTLTEYGYSETWYYRKQ